MKKLLLFIAVLSIVLPSCVLNSVKGNGDITDKEYSESGFKNIDASGSYEIHITQGSSYSVKVKCDANLFDYLNIYTKGDKLYLEQKNNTSISPSQKIKVYVTAPAYSDFDCSGACSIISDNKISGDKLSLDLSGAGKLNLDVEMQFLDVDMSGASEGIINGSAKSFSLDGSGATKIYAFGLSTENTKIDLSGSGKAEVSVSSDLSVEISGAGSVRYKGNPTIQQEISGAGSISKAE